MRKIPRRLRVTILGVVGLLIATAIGAGVVQATAVESTSAGVVDIVSPAGWDYADGNSQNSDISDDGQYVVFGSGVADPDLDGDVLLDNGYGDIFIRDRMNMDTELVSVSTAGVQGNGPSSQPSISGDGRYVAFQSAASNLSGGDGDSILDIYVRDVLLDVTTLMSVSDTGNKGNGNSQKPSIATDEDRVFVAYESVATNLVASDTNGSTRDVFVSYFWKYDPAQVYTELVSRRTNGTQGSNPSGDPSISGDGTYIAYESDARLDDNSPNDTDSHTDIYVTDWDKDGTIGNMVTELASVKTGGGEISGQDCLNPSISADGKYVAYDTTAKGVVSPSDANSYADVYVTDWNHGPADITTVKASVNTTGGEANGGSEYAALSGDGRYVAFESGASDLIAADGNEYRDVFVRDLLLGVTYRVSQDFFGTESDGPSGEHGASAGPQITAALNGEAPEVSFFSRATNLVYFDDLMGGDTGGYKNVFVGTTDTRPVIKQLIPSSGPTAGGNEVIIIGKNFLEDLNLVFGLASSNTTLSATFTNLVPALWGIYFDSTPVTDWFWYSPMVLVAAAPAHEPGTVRVKVVLTSGTTADTEADDYTYVGDKDEGEDGGEPKAEPDDEKENGSPGDGAPSYITTKVRYTTRYEQDSAKVVYTGEWTSGENDGLSKKSYTFTDDDTATITITFTGTQLDWIGTLGPDMGKALVSVDGGEAVLVDLYSDAELLQQVIWSSGVLAYGEHTVVITFPEGEDYVVGKSINADAFDVYGPIVTKVEELVEEF